MAKPCRRCGKAEKARFPSGRVRSCYCEACARAVRVQRDMVRRLCGSKVEDHDTDWCHECTSIAKARRQKAAQRGAQTRHRNHPHRARPENAQEFWQRLALRMVRGAKEMGLLPELDGSIACADCGAVAEIYEHRDYSRPLDVEPVCKPCNSRRGTAIWPSADHFQFQRIPHKKVA